MTTTGHRRALSHLESIRQWLATPAARLLVPRRARRSIRWLVEEMDASLSRTTQHLQVSPTIGTRVRLLRTDPFLIRDAGAVVGSVGKVVRHSRLAPDDHGVLVDWGNGRAIRSDLDELALA